MATGFSSTRPRRQAGSHGRSQTRPRMAGKDVALPIQHEGGGIAPLRDQPDVLGNGRMGRTRPLAVDDLVEVIRIGNVGRGRAAPASRLDLARRASPPSPVVSLPTAHTSRSRCVIPLSRNDPERIFNGLCMPALQQPEKPLCLEVRTLCGAKTRWHKGPLGVSSISQCRKAVWCALAGAPRPSERTRGCGHRRPGDFHPSGRWSSRE